MFDAFIILAGPTKTIVFSYSDNLANYFVDMFSLALSTVKKTNNGIMTGQFFTGPGGYPGHLLLEYLLQNLQKGEQ